MNAHENRRAARKAAMPHVQKLVRKYGIGTIGGCIAQLRAQNKTKKNIAALERELSELKRKV